MSDLLAQIASELDCTESDAALALSALLTDVGDRAPHWFDIQCIKGGHLAEPVNVSELSLMLQQLQDPDPEYDPHLTRDEIWDLWDGGADNKRKLLGEHYGVRFAYSYACFRREEIEPMLRDAGLLAEISAQPSAAPLQEQNADAALDRLSIGQNRRARVEAWVVSRAQALVKADDTKESLASRIVAEIQLGVQGDRGPITAESVVRMLPSGITGGKAKNGRKSAKR